MIKSRRPEKKVIHVYEPHAENDHVLGLDSSSPTLLNKDTGSHVQDAITRHINKFLRDQFNNDKPAANDLSWSSQTRHTVRKEPRDWYLVREAWHLLPLEDSRYEMMHEQSDYAFPERVERAHYDAAHTLLACVLREADVVCTTPSVSRQLQHFSETWPWKPDLIIVDKIDQISQATAMIPVAEWPSVPAIFVGEKK